MTNPTLLVLFVLGLIFVGSIHQTDVQVTHQTIAQTSPKSPNDPLAILTFEDFIATWRKRVDKGDGSKEVLMLYDAAKETLSIEAFEKCITLAEEVKDRWGEAVCLLDAYESIPQKMNASPETRKLTQEWTRRGGALGREILGSELGPYATSLNHLALLAFKFQKDDKTAQSLYEEALSIQEKALGTEHLEVATTLNNLASLFKTQGDYARAKALYERALSIKEKAFGEEHPSVATTLNNLASVCFLQGDYAGAMAFNKRALSIRENVLGPEHPLVAESLNNLAALLQTQGDYAGAKALYERVLSMNEKLLGSEHMGVAANLNNLASLLKAEGDYAGDSARALAHLRQDTLKPTQRNGIFLPKTLGRSSAQS